MHRENESINLHVLKFVYAWNSLQKDDIFSLKSTVTRRILLDALRTLDGPRLMFHSSLTGAAIDQISAYLPALQQRLGQALPLSLATRDPLDGIRSEEEFLTFSSEFLFWLPRQFFPALRANGHNSGSLETVVRRLDLLCRLRTPDRFTVNLVKFAGIRFRRVRMVRRMKA
ncbi:MAG: hypothetical protein ACKO3T_27355 [Planctomycetaceae bacterium]